MGRSHHDMHEQLLPFETPALSTTAWQDALSDRLQQPCQVVYGRSRSTPVQVHRQPGGPTRVRLHRFFETAPGPVVEALGRWIHVGRRARSASRLLDDWIAAELANLPRPDVSRLTTRGQVYDLGSMLGSIVAEYVPELLESPPDVTWGPRRRSKSRRSLHLGSYDPQTRIVRIHPVLDHRSVPEFFVRFILFHELLHAAIPTGSRPGSRHHPPQFQARERAHPDCAAATRFEEEHLDRLIRRARRGYKPTPSPI